MANNTSHSVYLGKAPFTLYTAFANKFVMRTGTVEYSTYKRDIEVH